MMLKLKLYMLLYKVNRKKRSSSSKCARSFFYRLTSMLSSDVYVALQLGELTKAPSIVHW